MPHYITAKCWALITFPFNIQRFFLQTFNDDIVQRTPKVHAIHIISKKLKKCSRNSKKLKEILSNESENCKNANGMSASLRMIYLTHFIFLVASKNAPPNIRRMCRWTLESVDIFEHFFLSLPSVEVSFRRLLIRNEEMCTLWFFCALLYIFVIFLILVILWSRVSWLEAMLSFTFYAFFGASALCWNIFFRVFWYWSFMCHKSMIRCFVLEGGNLMSFCWVR